VFFSQARGRLIATETRIVFLEQKGVFGSVVESFNYSRINALEITKGLIFAEMTITSGVAAQQVQWIPKFQLTRFVELVQGTTMSLRHRERGYYIEGPVCRQRRTGRHVQN
jgi:hypothetical protein